MTVIGNVGTAVKNALKDEIKPVSTEGKTGRVNVNFSTRVVGKTYAELVAAAKTETDALAAGSGATVLNYGFPGGIQAFSYKTDGSVDKYVLDVTGTLSVG